MGDQQPRGKLEPPVRRGMLISSLIYVILIQTKPGGNENGK
jgi:hypothetical protein